MNIIVVKPKAAIKMDSDVYCQALTKLGHNICNVEFNNGNIFIPVRKYDLIWCPYEQEIPLGLKIKEELKIPIVGHFEWIPPWRVNEKEISEWGYNTQEEIEVASKEIEKLKPAYKQLLNFYLKCDIMTIPTQYCLNTLQQFHTFTEEELKRIRIKPYIVDDRFLLPYKQNIQEENTILTIGRLVPHKKIDHVIEALSYIKNHPKLKILGYGNEKQKLTNLAKKLNVNIEFVGVGQEGSKAIEIQKCKFLVTPFTSLPVGEAALFKKPTILYRHPNVIQKHGNMGYYVAKDDTSELAEIINYWLMNPDEVKKEGQNSYDKLMSNESGLKTTENACNEMIKIFKEVIK